MWFTGVPGAGKTTLARALEAALRQRGAERVAVLDGDELRLTPLARGLGFSKEDRDENVRRVGLIAELLARSGFGVLVALVSPYEAVREEVRGRFDRFTLVHVDCAIEVLERRDPKGHYAKARRGEIVAFTGVSDPYEPPARPDLVIRTDRVTLAESLRLVVTRLKCVGHIPDDTA